ncbi:MAG: hypothetical protein ACREIA_13520 [Opitutaceae bacterium]
MPHPIRNIRILFARAHCSASLILLLVAVGAVPATAVAADADDSAIQDFPGAEGEGAFTPGGRGGRVIEVTNLADRGPGSFRAAVEAAGPRTVVFRVSGVVTLQSPVRIAHPFLAIAGQTAPGDGICIHGNTTIIDAPDVVIRHLGFDRGDLQGHAAADVVLDQCEPCPAGDVRHAALRSIPAPADLDHDGMPDAWERRHRLDFGNPAGGVGDPDDDGYTNLEEFLNDTAPRKVAGEAKSESAAPAVLDAAAFEHHVEFFNAMENETVVNLVPNAQAWDWMKDRVPLFEAEDASLEEIYWFRWWALRKHLRRDPKTGKHTLTEFINKERTISSALGHNLMEGRWLRDQAPYDDWVLYWLRGYNGGPQEHLHKYSQWLADALYQRHLVTGDRRRNLPFAAGRDEPRGGRLGAVHRRRALEPDERVCLARQPLPRATCGAWREAGARGARTSEGWAGPY